MVKRILPAWELDLPIDAAVDANGKLYLALTGENTPEPDQWEEFAVPYVVPDPEPRPELPSQPIFAPMVNRWAGDMNNLGTGNVGNEDSAFPFIIADALDVTPALEPRILAFYYGPEAIHPRYGKTKEEAYTLTVEKATRLGRPVLVNDDGKRQWAIDTKHRFRGDGCTVIRMFAWDNAYVPAGISAGEWVVFQQQTFGNEAEACRQMNECLEFCNTFPVGGVLSFGGDRPPVSEWMRQAWLSFCASVIGRGDLYLPPPTVPTKPPQPSSDSVKTTNPPTAKKPSVWLAIAEALAKLFNRRKK